MIPPTQCIGNDPACPCQDGLACHYQDIPGSPGWPVKEEDAMTQTTRFKAHDPDTTEARNAALKELSDVN